MQVSPNQEEGERKEKQNARICQSLTNEEELNVQMWQMDDGSDDYTDAELN